MSAMLYIRPGIPVAALMLAAIMLMPEAARAGDGDGGALIYASDGAIWLRNDDGKGKREKLADAPAGGPVVGIQASPRLRRLLVQTDKGWYWIARDRRSQVRRLDCTGPATMSANGRCIVCAAGGVGLVYLEPKGRKQRKLVLPFGRAPADFRRAGIVVTTRRGGLWLTDLRGKRYGQLAPHQPAEVLSVSPDGERAVAILDAPIPTRVPQHRQKDDARVEMAPALYGFRLDGEGTKRRLLATGIPGAWSGDSRWLLVNQENDGCVIRAVGGQYKCWTRYQAVAIDGDGSHVFLTRPDDDGKTLHLYRASTKGAKPARPRKIISDVGRAALWTRQRPGNQ